jgi:hypothetical protein
VATRSHGNFESLRSCEFNREDHIFRTPAARDEVRPFVGEWIEARWRSCTVVVGVRFRDHLPSERATESRKRIGLVEECDGWQGRTHHEKVAAVECHVVIRRASKGWRGPEEQTDGQPRFSSVYNSASSPAFP